MNSKQVLLQKLKKQYIVETGSRDSYSELVTRFSDKKLKKSLSFIAEQEIEHMQDVTKMIDLINNYKKEVRVKKSNFNEDSVANALSSINALLLVGIIDSYLNKSMLFVKKVIEKNNVLYVSFNKMPSFIKDSFESHKVALSKIKFISCASIDSGNYISIRPEDLTQLSITLTEETQKKKGTIVIVDNVTSFSTFHPPERITKFVSVINDKARGGQFKVVWLAVSDADEKGVIERIAPICDKEIKL